MKIILSPAKNMNIRSFKNVALKDAIFKQETLHILEKLKEYEPYELESLMKINPELALKTFCYFKDFNITDAGGHALISYDGLVFKNIDAKSFDEDDILFAEQHIRLLSGFYGLLTPCTNILPYRLEMQCKLSLDDKKDLYKFWQDKIYKELFKETNTVLNLASKEYYKVVTPFLTNEQKIINVDFLVNKNNKNKVIATSAKIARGQMARYIIKNKITNLDDIKHFKFDDYNFYPYLSTNDNIVFLKKY